LLSSWSEFRYLLRIGLGLGFRVRIRVRFSRHLKSEPPL
jgi:hypothetical protein